jgi:hypothetical protein
MVNSMTEWYRPSVRGDVGAADVGTAVVELAMDALRARR